MTELSEDEVRQTLRSVLSSASEPYTWMTGMVGIVTRTGDEVSGRLLRVEQSAAVVATSAGEQSILMSDVVNVLIDMESPGPE